MANNTIFRGYASIEGISGAFDVIAWLPQTGKFNDNFAEEVIQDQHGADCAWLARNQHLMGDVAFKVVGGEAKAALLNQSFPMAPYTVINLSGFDFATDGVGGAGLNGKYLYMSGADLNLTFDKVADATFKLKKYTNPAQATLSATVPA